MRLLYVPVEGMRWCGVLSMGLGLMVWNMPECKLDWEMCGD